MKRPSIECFDPNNWSSDTSYYVANKSHEGFILPANYKPFGYEIENERFTPNDNQTRKAELILSDNKLKYNSYYKRQYLGSINLSLDSLITINLTKKGFKMECFDKMFLLGSGAFFEKNQRLKIVNLTTGKIEF